MKVFSKKNGSTIGMPNLRQGNLQVNELKMAERNVVRCVQRTSFQEIITALRKEGTESKKTSSEICKIFEAVVPAQSHVER